jgi:hypothetical protein
LEYEALHDVQACWILTHPPKSLCSIDRMRAETKPL